MCILYTHIVNIRQHIFKNQVSHDKLNCIQRGHYQIEWPTDTTMDQEDTVNWNIVTTIY